MIKSSIEKIAEDIGFDAEDIGFDIANSNDITQSNLLNGLGKGFAYMSNENYRMQLAYVSSKLNAEAVRLILELSEFVKNK